MAVINTGLSNTSHELNHLLPIPQILG
ncbi:MAG: hypothetical protein ACJAYV_002573, partial [Oleispira sp.]